MKKKKHIYKASLGYNCMLRIINELISEELLYWHAIIRPKNSPHGQNFVKEVSFLVFFTIAKQAQPLLLKIFQNAEFNF